MLEKINGRLSYIMMGVGVLVIGLISLVVFSISLFTVEIGFQLDQNERAVVNRMLEITDQKDAVGVFLKALESEQIYLDSFVQQQFTSSSYLFQQKNESDFLVDLNYVILGTREEAGFNEDAENKSRQSLITEAIKTAGFKHLAPAQNERTGTKILSWELEKDIATEENFSFGIRKIGGVLSANGTELRGDVYLDGDLQSTASFFEEDDENLNCTLLWDSREIRTGEYQSTVLLRSSDGRGVIMSDKNIVIPNFFSFVNDYVQRSHISADKDFMWFALDAQDRNAYINFVGLSGDVKVSLYDLYGNRIGVNDAWGKENETLRGRKQELDDTMLTQLRNESKNLFYVKVERGSSSGVKEEIDFTAVMSKEVIEVGNEGFLSVSIVSGSEDQEDPELLCRDLNGDEFSYKKSDVNFLPLNGYLSSLFLKNENGEQTHSFFPAFQKNTNEYALVLSEGTDKLLLDYVGTEGYAAEYTISLTDENDKEIKIEQDDAGKILPLAKSRNKLQIAVQGFDEDESLYTIFLLSGSDSNGFDRSTMSKFPQSYWNGLWLLHSLNPNHQFEAFDTGLTWEEVLQAQEVEGRSLIDNEAWSKPGSPVYDGSSWKAARRDVVEYFLDPRNFLDPMYVFQFEKLSFDESVHQKDGVSVMLKSSFMDTEEQDYAEYIMRAGREANASPYFLASRILQEMGPSGESMLAHGTLPGYEGYFNFYNIGSTPNTAVENGALINGARYAMWGKEPDAQVIDAEEAELMIPWDSAEKSIIGGGKWIAARYIQIGQDTLYYQKFDVIDNEDGLYQHQYATNIAMAHSEGRRYYQTYRSMDMLDSAFVFSIPVYLDMPTELAKWPS